MKRKLRVLSKRRLKPASLKRYWRVISIPLIPILGLVIAKLLSLIPGASEWLGSISSKKMFLANVSSFVLLWLLVTLILLTSFLYTLIDYKIHKKPLVAEMPTVIYTPLHHIRVVTLPLIRYRWKELTYWIYAGTTLLLVLAGALSTFSFISKAAEYVDVTTGSVTNKTETSANLSNDTSLDSVTASGFEYGTTTDYGSTIASSANNEGKLAKSFGSYGSGADQYQYPESVDIAANGDVFVADTGNHRIKKLDSHGTLITQWGTQGSANSQFGALGPMSIAVGTNRVYVTDPSNTRVQIFDTSGSYIGQKSWAANSYNGQLAVDSSNNLYSGKNLAITKYDSDGNITSTWDISSGEDPSVFIRDIAIDTAGNVYAAISNNDNNAAIQKIKKYNSSGTLITSWNLNSSTYEDTHGLVYSIDIDASNHMYLYFSNFVMQVYDTSGNYIYDWYYYHMWPDPVGSDWQDYFGKIAVNNYGNVYAPHNQGDGRISIFGPTYSGVVENLTCGTIYHYRAYATNTNGTSYGEDRTFRTNSCSQITVITKDATAKTQTSATLNGSNTGPNVTSRGFEFGTNTDYGTTYTKPNTLQYSYDSQFGSSGTNPGQFGNGFMVATDAQGNTYTTDGTRHKVMKFDSNGNFLLEWGGFCSGLCYSATFNIPVGIAVDKLGYVWVADYGNSHIKKFDANGNYIDAAFVPSVSSITFDDENNMYVTGYSGKVSKYDANGGPVTEWGSLGSGNGQFQYPVDIETDHDGNVYVVDGGLNRIQKFSSTGEYLLQWGSLGTGDGQFNLPAGIDISDEGIITVSDLMNNRLQRFTSDGVYINQFTLGSGDGLFNGPQGIASYQDHTYVMDRNNDRVVKLAATGGTGDFSYDVSDLECGTTYHYRAWAANSGGSRYGLDKSFTTEACPVPQIADLELNSTLVNTGQIKSGDTVTYHNVVTNNGPAAVSISQSMLNSLFALPSGITYQSVNSADDFNCFDSEQTSPNNVYFAQHMTNNSVVACAIDTNAPSPKTLNSGEDLTFDIVGVANSDLQNGAQYRGIFFYVTQLSTEPYELEEFTDQTIILTGIYMSIFSNTLNEFSNTNIFTLNMNNVDSVTYTYNATPDPDPNPDPDPTPHTDPPTTGPTTPTTPSNPSTPPTTPTTNTPTSDPETNPETPQSNPTQTQQNTSQNRQQLGIMDRMKGWFINPLVAVVEPVPTSVAKTIPWSLLLLLLALAAYYAYVTYLEQRRRKDIQAIIQRYRNSQATRSVYLNITSHYVNTPIAVMQGALQLVKKDGQLNEDVYIATDTQLNKLAKNAQRVLTETQDVSSAQMATIRQLENLKLPSLLSRPVMWLPILVLMTLAILANFIFIQADKYPANIINIGAQIGIAFVGIAALLTSYYYFRKTRGNLQILSSQLELEKHYTEQQVSFIQEAYNELNEDVTALGMVSKPVLALPRGSVFKDGLDRLYHSITELSKLQLLAKHVTGLSWKTNVNEVTKQALSGIRQLSDQAGVGVVTNIDPYLLANIDETSLYHLIESTLDNAIKFSQMGSQVLLSIRSVNDGVMITVQDHGQGISTELQHHLLLPFTRDSIEQFEYDGMGLDLYMCRLILEHYKGKIAITSEPQKGTTVQMLVPSAST